jgi:hypothetical protein
MDQVCVGRSYLCLLAACVVSKRCRFRQGVDLCLMSLRFDILVSSGWAETTRGQIMHMGSKALRLLSILHDALLSTSHRN